MIKGVVFDMGGTVLEYGGRNGWRQAWTDSYRAVHSVLTIAGYEGSWETFHSTVGDFEDRMWMEATGGRLSPTLHKVIATACDLIGFEHRDGLVGRCVDAYVGVLQAICEPFPDSASTLATLKARGLKIGLLSNTFIPGTIHGADLGRFGLLEYFDDLVFSGDVGLWKPQRAAFELALRNVGLKPSEAIFVGDRMIDDVGGAQATGMIGVLKERLDGDNDYVRATRLGIVPDARIRHLAELPDLIRGLDGFTG